MAENPALVVITNKIATVERYIADMEARIERARVDLVHLNACVEMFRRGDVDAMPVHFGMVRVFQSGELRKLALEALQDAPPEGRDVRFIAAYVMQAKGINANEKPFRRTLIRSLTVVLGKMANRGKCRCVGSRGGVKVWIV